jgi:stalled ribosome alternative rescue factor ArfA
MKRRVSVQYDMETEIIGFYDKDTGELDFEWDDAQTYEAMKRATDAQHLIIHELFRCKYSRNAKTRGIYRRYQTFIKRASGLS